MDRFQIDRNSRNQFLTLVQHEIVEFLKLDLIELLKTIKSEKSDGRTSNKRLYFAVNWTVNVQSDDRNTRSNMQTIFRPNPEKIAFSNILRNKITKMFEFEILNSTVSAIQ